MNKNKLFRSRSNGAQLVLGDLGGSGAAVCGVLVASRREPWQLWGRSPPGRAGTYEVTRDSDIAYEGPGGSDRGDREGSEPGWDGT